MDPDVDPDLDLLARWRAGDNDAGNELFRRHFDRVVWFFRNKVPQDVLEDLVQDTFAACVESVDGYRGSAPFRTYLLGVASNMVRSFYRKRQRKGGDRIDFGVTSILDLGPSPSAIAAERSEQALLLRALQAIPLEHQIVLELFYWETKSAAAIGQILDLPEGTVRTRLRRARQLLGEQVERATTDAALLESTLAGLDEWVQRLRQHTPE